MRSIWLLALLLVASISSAALPQTKVFDESASADVRAPLYTAAEESLFEKTYGQLVRDARAAGASDLQAVHELLVRKFDATRTNDGFRRLLILRAISLSQEAKLGAANVKSVADKALAAISEPSIATSRARIDVISTARAAGVTAEGRYSDAALAEEYLSLADAQRQTGDAKAAVAALDLADLTAARSVAAARIITPRVAALRRAMADAAALEAALARNPNDPKANEQRGLQLLLGSEAREMRAAAKYLAKSSSKPLQGVAEVLQRKAINANDRLDLANALFDTLPSFTGEAQLALASLMFRQLDDVQRDQTATDADRARGELLAIKVERLTASGKRSGTSSGAASAPAPAADATTTASGGVAFFGVAANAPKIVFVLDHSGSMLDSFDFLRQEVKRSVSRMLPTQEFALVIFNEQVDRRFPDKGLARATAETKREVETWLDAVKAQGENDDLLDPFSKAISAAIELRGDVIYFLTDGNFDPRVVAKVRLANVGRKVKINTIAFVKITKEAEQNLIMIAQENGGKYKFVREKDLGQK